MFHTLVCKGLFHIRQKKKIPASDCVANYTLWITLFFKKPNSVSLHSIESILKQHTSAYQKLNKWIWLMSFKTIVCNKWRLNSVYTFGDAVGYYFNGVFFMHLLADLWKPTTDLRKYAENFHILERLFWCKYFYLVYLPSTGQGSQGLIRIRLW